MINRRKYFVKSTPAKPRAAAKNSLQNAHGAGQNFPPGREIPRRRHFKHLISKDKIIQQIGMFLA
jgi:hypothetical protein